MKIDTYKMFTNCIPVKGNRRSIICDLQRGTFHLIPNILYEILVENTILSVEVLVKKYGIKYAVTIKEYLDFLIGNEYIFECLREEVSFFPNLNLDWQHFAQITNSIIELDSISPVEFKKIISELEELGCKNIEIRFFALSQKKILDYFEVFDDSIVSNVTLVVKYHKKLCSKKEIIAIMNSTFGRLKTVIHHSNYINSNSIVNNTRYYRTKEKIESSDFCGVINWKFFSLNIPTFTESQKHNTCLNRKISIDVNGEIKNCPSMTKSYGNIRDTTLKEAIEKPGFKDMWFIHKDQIDVCKDCEFRYICTDCRIFIKDTDDIFSKPSKCNYNPYISQWEE